MFTLYNIVVLLGVRLIFSTNRYNLIMIFNFGFQKTCSVIFQIILHLTVIFFFI